MRETNPSKTASVGKENSMEEDMNLGELIEKLARESERQAIEIEALKKKNAELEKELEETKALLNK